MRANPLTYGVAALRWALYGTAPRAEPGCPDRRSQSAVTIAAAPGSPSRARPRWPCEARGRRVSASAAASSGAPLVLAPGRGRGGGPGPAAAAGPSPRRSWARCRRSRSPTGTAGRSACDDLAGRPWVADFIFTRCPASCPMMTARMARLDRDLPGGARTSGLSPSPSTPPRHPGGPAALRRLLQGPGPLALPHRGEEELRRLSVEGFKLGLDMDPAPGTAEPRRSRSSTAPASCWSTGRGGSGATTRRSTRRRWRSCGGTCRGRDESRPYKRDRDGLGCRGDIHGARGGRLAAFKPSVVDSGVFQDSRFRMTFLERRESRASRVGRGAASAPGPPRDRDSEEC